MPLDNSQPVGKEYHGLISHKSEKETPGSYVEAIRTGNPMDNIQPVRRATARQIYGSTVRIYCISTVQKNCLWL
jgi:hypothetical protein